MSLAEVTTLRPGPLLNDIVGQLRQLADRMERGEVQAEACYVVLMAPDDFNPTFYGWGAVADRHGLCGVFSHVARLALHSARD